MTSPDLPPPRTPAAVALPGAPGVPVAIRTQAELVAAIPALIGFHPHDSLVLLAVGGRGGRRLGLTLRIDLPPPEHVPEVVPDLATAAVRGLLLDSPTGAVVVVVTAGGGAGQDDRTPPHAELVAHVVRELDRNALEVHAAMWAEGTWAGAGWHCYDECGCSGALPDPATTPVLAAAVAGGQVVHADRAALERLVAPADHDRVRRRELLLIRAIDRETGVEPAGEPPDPDTVDPDTVDPDTVDPDTVDPGVPDARVLNPDAPDLSVVDAAIADAEAGRLQLDDQQVVALAIALSAPAVRDAALLRCLGPWPTAAEQLWAALARETPDPEAAEPAALLAVSALLRGDGALANVALDRAERAWPGHRLTGLLRLAAEGGLRPSEIRAWLIGSAEPVP